jgi:hypothetical protein
MCVSSSFFFFLSIHNMYVCNANNYRTAMALAGSFSQQFALKITLTSRGGGSSSMVASHTLLGRGDSNR